MQSVASGSVRHDCSINFAGLLQTSYVSALDKDRIKVDSKTPMKSCVKLTWKIECGRGNYMEGALKGLGPESYLMFLTMTQDVM